MKIKKEHLEVMKKAIDEVLEKHNPTGELVAFYESGAVKAKDLQMRFCFDLLYAAGLNQFVCKELYQYANDEHIYTALKKICPKLNVQ